MAIGDNGKIKCANCGSRLAVSLGASEISCGLCGTKQIVEHHDGFDEVVEVSPAPHRVIDVFRYLVRHPVEMLVYRWNWKAAVLSGLTRSMIYLFTHIKEGWRAALGAMTVEFVFRVIVSGASGSLVQAFHRATPIWLATLCVMILLPGFSHMIEFTLHTLNGDANKGRAIVISVTFSILSAIFNLFAMRRNALLVKDKDQQSFARDMAQMPAILAEFIFYPLIWMWRKSKKKAGTLNEHLSQSPDLADRKS